MIRERTLAHFAVGGQREKAEDSETVERGEYVRDVIVRAEGAPPFDSGVDL
jgi:hypothetical protein